MPAITPMLWFDGRPFTVLNGGPRVRFNEAVSFVIDCSTQEEMDHYWQALGAGGDPAAQKCGWLKDRYGLSWLVTPRYLLELLWPTPTRRAPGARCRPCCR